MDNKRGKILILATRGDIGGVQVFVLGLAHELLSRGLDVTVGYGPGSYLPAEIRNAGLKGLKFRWLRRTHNPLANFLFAAELWLKIRKYKFNIIHFNSANTLIGVIAGRFAGRARSVFSVHGLSVLDDNYHKLGFLKPLYRLYFRLLLALADQTVYISEANRRSAAAQRLTSGGEIVYNGIEASSLDFLDRQAGHKFFTDIIGIDLKDNFVIGSIGRLTYQKNYEFLITAFPGILRIIPNAVAILIGDGENRLRYAKQIETLGLENKVILAGELINAHRYLKSFDLFVLPSRYEGLPLTLIECLFAPLPCLAANVGGSGEVLGDESQLYGLGNQQEFLSKLKRIFEDNNLRGQMAERNLARSQKFLLSRMADEYVKIYGL